MRAATLILTGLLVFSLQTSLGAAEPRDDGAWLLQETATLHATGVGPNMRFGHSLSVSGETALIGAPNCLNQCPPAQPGRAFVFERDPESGQWGEPQSLIASQGVPSDEFGYSVLLDGDTAFIGAMRAAIDGNNQQGAVYVFERDTSSGEWTEQLRLTAANGGSGERFGYSLALAGDTLLVGANGVSTGDGFSQGGVYVFERDTGSGEWVEQTLLIASDADSQDAFGSVVAFDGQHALIGAPSARADGNSNQGKAYFFEYDQSDGSWTERGMFTLTQGQIQARFGSSVALGEGQAVVGAPGANIDGDSERGMAYVFAQENGNWQQVQSLAAPDGSRFHRFGSAVSMQGERAVIGAEGAYADGHRDRGAIYRWERDADGQWSYLDRVDGSGLISGDRFGASVYLADGRILAGAPHAEANHLEGQGVVRVFEAPEPGLVVSPGALDFGPAPADGAGLPRTVTLYNTGTDPVEVSQQDFPEAPFSVTDDGCGPAPFTLPADDHCDITLLFEPTGAGPVSAVLETHSDATGSPHLVELMGTGTSHGLQYKLVASDGGQNDRFSVVAIEDDLAVVGAYGAASPGGTSHGAAYVFQRDPLDGSWEERARLEPDDGAFGDDFGTSVAINDGQVFIGASGRNVDGNNNHGSVFVFEQDAGGVWQQTELLPDELGQAGFGGVRFGASLATGNDRLLIGARGENAAYLFERNASGQWQQHQRLVAEDDTSSFGASVALDGDRLLVGAPASNVDGNPLQGSAHVFELDANGDWVEQPRLTASDGQNLDRFGHHLALSGNRVVIGSPPTLNANRFGRIHIYERDTGSGEWTEQVTVAADNGRINDLFGSSVILSEDTVVVGAPGYHAGGHFESGAAFVFEYSASDGQWRQQFMLDAFDARQSDAFGTHMAMSGSTLMIGAEARVDGYNNRGAVYVFDSPTEVSGLYIAPDPLVFSAVAAGETDGPRSVTLINSDPQPITVTGVSAATEPFYAQGGSCGAVPFIMGPGTSCTLLYTFTPPETGGYGETIEVVSSASSSPDYFGLQSEGLEREMQVGPANLDFDTVAAGQVGGPLSVELANTGELDVTIQTVQPPGGPFVPVSDSCGATNVVPTTLAPGATCVLEYSFHPAAVGEFQAQLDIVSNAPSSPDTVSLSGVGGGAVLQADPESLSATVASNQSGTLLLDIANPGNETLNWNLTEAPDSAGALLRVSGEASLPRVSGPDAASGGFIHEQGAVPGQRVSPDLLMSDINLTLTHSESLDVMSGNSMGCASSSGSSQASYLRTFTLTDFGISTNFEVEELVFGIQSLTVETPVTINLHLLDGDFVYDNMELIGTATHTLESQNLSVVTVPVAGNVPPGGTLVVEVQVPDLVPQQGAFFIGSNDLGESADSYVVAPMCGIDEPVSVGSLGSTDMHVVMAVSGWTSDCEHPGWLQAGPTSGAVNPGSSQTLEVALDPSETGIGTHTGTLCLESNDPVTPLTLVPVSMTVTPPEPAKEIAALIASDGASDDWLGRSVAIDGDTIMVSADAADINGNSNQGAVYVFEYADDAWTQQAKLVADDGEQFAQFGFSIGLSGDTAIVGGATSQNGVYVFERDASGWSQRSMFVADEAAPDDNFGIAVALDGDTAVVGARTTNVDGSTNQGAAYVFVREGQEWVQQARLTASDGVAYNLFGDAVAVSGDTVIVGSAFHNTGGNNNQGAAYVFTREGEEWTEQAKLFDAEGMPNDWFGHSVALDGDTAVIGANRINAVGEPGAAYVFTRQGGSWEPQAYISSGEIDDAFGESVAVQGDTVIVGAFFADAWQGAAHAYRRSDGTWDDFARLSASGGMPDDQFGSSVDIDGNRVVVGAWTTDVGANPRQGVAYVFELDLPSEPGELEVDPAELIFGQVPVGETHTATLNAHNSGSIDQAEPLEIETIEIAADPAFEIVGGSCDSGVVLFPEESCTLEIAFTPLAEEAFVGSVGILTVDGQTATVDLTGEGIEAEPPEDTIFRDRFQADGAP